MLRLGGVAVCLVVLSAGCLGSDAERDASSTTQPRPPPATTTAPWPPGLAELPDPQRWATRVERDWLRPYQRWAARFRAPLDAFPTDEREIQELNEGDPEAIQELIRLLGPWETCSGDLAAMVPPPPTIRLRELATQAEAACTRLGRVFALLEEASAAGDSGAAAFTRAGQELRRAVTTLVLLGEKLPPGGAQRLPIVDAAARTNHVNPRYGRAAGSIVELATEVRCWSRRDWRRLLREAEIVTGTSFDPADTGGFAMVASRRVHLSPLVCTGLDALIYRDARPRDRAGRLLLSFAVETLAHEGIHRGGVADEAVAQCYGMQRIHAVARELGVGRKYAEGLAALSWATYGDLPPAYRSPECRSEGELDLDPAAAGPWDY